eukprot:763101-Hanusia_phi.AAC.2
MWFYNECWRGGWGWVVAGYIQHGANYHDPLRPSRRRVELSAAEDSRTGEEKKKRVEWRTRSEQRRAKNGARDEREGGRDKHFMVPFTMRRNV